MTAVVFFARSSITQVVVLIYSSWNLKHFSWLHFFSWMFVQLLSSWFKVVWFFFFNYSLIKITQFQLIICFLIASIPEKGRMVCAGSIYVVKIRLMRHVCSLNEILCIFLTAFSQRLPWAQLLSLCNIN